MGQPSHPAVERLTLDTVDTTRARVYYQDGRVLHFREQKDAYSYWLNVPRGILVAMRNANELTPVYHHDYVDTR